MPLVIWHHFCGDCVRHEPIVSEDTDDEALVADLGIRDVWAPQSEALFDVKISDTDA